LLLIKARTIKENQDNVS